ncbi:MAG TPA: dihydroneopterin aldolase family protein [Methanocorpusculum sp.]|nr:dihydroneopterin aldolase family protein [Methanocorpusculum sp.]
MATDRENAVFEAAIKLGALYHQFVGTPISRSTADKVEAAIESAVSLQPYVTHISVKLNRDLMNENPFGYSELTGAMYDAVIETKYGDAKCRAGLKFENGYPMMRILD